MPMRYKPVARYAASLERAKIDDDVARTVARNIRKRIENELSYPGSIEITVIREQRFQETAV